jgi:hypothetical protein
MHRLRISPAVRASTSDAGLVLLDVASGLVFAANGVGARIWQLLEQRCSRDEIVRQLTTDCDAPIDRVGSDLDAFVDALRARGLVTDDSGDY